VRNFKTDQDIVISCVIPVYNEEKNISKVLDAVTTYNRFDEISVINDGSSDNTIRIVKLFQDKCGNLRLISLQPNMGKAGAVTKGIGLSTGNLIVTLDADLIGLNHDNIDSLIFPVINGEADQTILDRAGDRTPPWGWTNFAKYFGGERAFWKKDFIEIDIPEDAGYLLEILENLHYMNTGKTMRTIFCKNLYTIHQYSKRGWIKGTVHYITMSSSIIKRAKVANIVKQVFWIENKSLYKLFYLFRKYPSSRPVIGPIIIIFHLLDGFASFIWLNLLKMVRIFTVG